MLLQWQEELDSRFGLHFEIMDKDFVQRVRQERGFGVNPWTTNSRFLVSQRLLIDEAYSGPMADWLDTFRPGTLLILDEAHHAAPASGQRYAIDSQITKVVRDIAQRFEHRLFLSATPHNGHSNSFSALLEILDPQRFCRGVKVSTTSLRDVMVRRLKDDLREVVGGFPRREVVQVNIEGLPTDAPELRLAELLDQYRRSRETRLSQETRRIQSASGLLICNLQQRLFSSVEAFSRTLRVHRKTVQRQWEAASDPSPKRQTLRLDILKRGMDADDDRSALPEAQQAAEEEAEIAAVSAATCGPTESPIARQLFEKEQALLDQMSEIAEAARTRPDARIDKIEEWIRANMCPDLETPGAKWTDIRVIIFTEYDDTKRYLIQQLTKLIAGTDRADDRIAVFHGPTPNDEREAIKSAFNDRPSRSPLRILVATDAAREGLNLQAHCWNLFHFDVPWNPSRLEQRNGRIDRKLQPNDVVYCHYFYYVQRPEDRVLRALVRKTKTIREELGSLSRVIDDRLDVLMKNGIRRAQSDVMAKEIDEFDLDSDQRAAVEEELEASRERKLDLKKQIDQLRNMLESSQEAISFSKPHFASAVSCALQILGAEPLKAISPGENGSKFVFPAMDQRQGADPTWASTMDSLREPRPRGKKLMVFILYAEDRGLLSNDPVYLNYYSITGLYERLRIDDGRYPDTMDQRFGAWVAKDPAVLAHQEWLGYVQPSGLVVSIPAMLEANVRINANQGPEHRQFLEYFLEDKDGEPIAMLGSFPEFAEAVLGWQSSDLYGAPGSEPLPDSLEAALPEYNETLRPTYALREFDPAPGASEWILLVQVLAGNPEFDAVPETDARHWQASPQAKFERLLRQTRVPSACWSIAIRFVWCVCARQGTQRAHHLQIAGDGHSRRPAHIRRFPRTASPLKKGVALGIEKVALAPPGCAAERREQSAVDDIGVAGEESTRGTASADCARQARDRSW